ncbi:MAG: hypothetical protein ACK5Y2_03650 [Bdellovibrionales bacterium]
MKTVLFVCMVFFLSVKAGANIQFQLHYSPLSNLVYQLDCLSHQLSRCSRQTYQDLWDRNFIKDKEDHEKIKQWGELISRYGKWLEFEETSQSSVPGSHEGVRLSTKIRIASFQSMTPTEYFSRLDLVVLPKDRLKFEQIVRHFYPRFERWWKTTALSHGRSFQKGTEQFLKGPDIATKIRQFAHFYSSKLPDNYTVHFSLFYRPKSNEPTSGQQIENYSISEFLSDEKPVERLDVIIHELCHFFFENGADGKFAGLQQSFANTGKIGSRAAYNLLNEALATAFGNGMINKLKMKKEKWEKYSAKDQSFYNNPHIDKAAKSILPWIEKWITEGKTLYDPGFVENYLASLEKAIGAELTSPRLVLNEFVLVADNGYNSKFRDQVRKVIRPSSMFTSEGEWSDELLLRTYQDKANYSTLLIVHPANLNELRDKGILTGEDFDRIKSHFGKSEQILFSFRRAPTVPGYLIVARSYEKALELVDKLVSLKEGFEGLYPGPQ